MQGPSHSSPGGPIAREGSNKRFRNDGEARVYRRPRGAMPPGIAKRSGEISNSNSASHQSKHGFHYNGARNCRYKGVVIQQNGHWGAQIYANQQRVWLGTFKSEEEAAMAYDSAAIALRHPDRNFPWSHISLQEAKFQNEFSTSAVLNMIKEGSYNRQFLDYLSSGNQIVLTIPVVHGNNGARMMELFHKELTPSDVGKLNRLVIPKKHAVKHFPAIPEYENDGTVGDVELMFTDRENTKWTFRYCYWKSSQSFVFTRGWNRFTKKKDLKPNDRVIFCAYDDGVGLKDPQRQYFIDVARGDRASFGSMATASCFNDLAQRYAVEQPLHGWYGSGVRMDEQHGGDEADGSGVEEPPYGWYGSGVRMDEQHGGDEADGSGVEEPLHGWYGSGVRMNEQHDGDEADGSGVEDMEGNVPTEVKKGVMLFGVRID